MMLSHPKLAAHDSAKRPRACKPRPFLPTSIYCCTVYEQTRHLEGPVGVGQPDIVCYKGQKQ
eukprot:302127-Chlamydomonas_euryale.AAC.2